MCPGGGGVLVLIRPLPPTTVGHYWQHRKFVGKNPINLLQDMDGVEVIIQTNCLTSLIQHWPNTWHFNGEMTTSCSVYLPTVVTTDHVAIIMLEVAYASGHAVLSGTLLCRLLQWCDSTPWWRTRCHHSCVTRDIVYVYVSIDFWCWWRRCWWRRRWWCTIVVILQGQRNKLVML